MSVKEKEQKSQKKTAEKSAHAEPASGNHEEVEILRRELEELKAEAAEYKDNLLRKAAEFENYRKRMTAEFASVIRNASENLIVDLLPVLDDMDRFLKSSDEQSDNNPAALRHGLELIRSKLNAVLSQRGLEPFDSIGQPFDVELHDAFLQMPKDDVPPNTVIEEVSRGYRLNSKILRHSKVVVSAPKEQSAETGTSTHDDDSRNDTSPAS